MATQQKIPRTKNKNKQHIEHAININDESVIVELVVTGCLRVLAVVEETDDLHLTRTLTVGKPVVVNTRLLKNMVLKDFFEIVAAAEVFRVNLAETCGEKLN
ncbi:cytochrome P450 [Striga asiatica]|uniref:Cytochrome P450 n=1 Tax=Striga asiatica TaxID=4170 RepID=A0A5A7P9B2_STRAF|nr:cytochrome P450 [Striga asiatica]